MFAGKNIQMTQKSFTRSFNQNKAQCGILQIDMYMAAKHKIILSWPETWNYRMTAYISY